MSRMGPALILAAGLALLASCGGDGDPTAPVVPPPEGRAARFRQAPTEPTSVSDSLAFGVFVEDSVNAVTDVLVQLRSDRDGVIAAGRPAADGWFGVTVPPLSRGRHRIELWADFGPAAALYDTVTVQNVRPARVLLLEPVVTPDGVALYWSGSEETTFLRYELRRWLDGEDYDDGRLVALFESALVTDVVDSLPPLAENVHYAVNVVIDGGWAAESAPGTAFRPNGPIMDFEPFDAALHPTETIVYVLDRRPNDSRLLALDYRSKAVLADRTFAHPLQYLDVADNGLGVEVYVSRHDDGISVLDPHTLAEIVHVPMGYGAGSVAADGRGRVYVSLGTGSWGVPPLRCYDRATWDLLGEGGHNWWTRLECVPGRDELIESTMGTSPVLQYHVTFDGAGALSDHVLLPRPEGAYRSADVLRVDPGGTYFLTHIWGSVYDADAGGLWQGNLPRPAGRYNDFGFNGDGSRIFVASSTSRGVPVYAPEGLLQTGFVGLRGYGRRVFTDGEFLISLSRPDMNVAAVCMDVVRLPAALRWER